MYNSFFSNNLVFLFSLLITFSKSQEISFEKIEAEIQNLCDTIVNSESDSSKFLANEKLIKKLKIISRKKKFHKYEFKNYNPITTLSSDDKKLKLFNWFIQKKMANTIITLTFKSVTKEVKSVITSLLKALMITRLSMIK